MQQKSSFTNCGNFIAAGRRSSRPNSVEISTRGRAPSAESTSRSTSEGSALHLLDLALDERCVDEGRDMAALTDREDLSPELLEGPLIELT